jgi:hypothetical protein
MSSSSGITAYGNSSNILSQWPAGVKYNPSTSRYLYSTNSTWNISALDHIHVVAIDTPQVGNVPKVMTLTLPILQNLPLGSRIYFFYVSQATANDQLVFVPVTGSGDTMNGNALGFTFVLSGEPELIIALGVNQNYILQAFGKNNNHGNSGIPTVKYAYDGSILPIVLASSPSGEFASSSDLIAGNASTGTEIEVIDGMAGYITPEVAVPTRSFQGYLCNKSGIYLVQPSLYASCNYLQGVAANSTNAGSLQSNWLEFDAAGAYVYSLDSTASVRQSDIMKGNAINTYSFQNPLVKFTIPANTGTIVSGGFTSGYAGVVEHSIILPAAAVSAASVIYPGMTGYIVPNQLIPVVTQYGYQCTVSGLYKLSNRQRFTCTFTIAGTTNGFVGCLFQHFTSAGSVVAADNILFPVRGGSDNGNVSPYLWQCFATGDTYVNLVAGDYYIFSMVYDWTGTPAVSNPSWDGVVYFEYMKPSTQLSTPIYWKYTDAFFYPMTAGHYYAPSFTYDNSSAGTTTVPFLDGELSFCYWAPLPGPGVSSLMSIDSSGTPAPGPSLLTAVRAQNTNSELFAPVSQPLSGNKAKQIQMAANDTAKLRSASYSASSSSSSSTPQFSLMDMERMINQAIEARERRSIIPLLSAPPPSSDPPHQKKRKLSEVGQGKKKA